MEKYLSKNPFPTKKLALRLSFLKLKATALFLFLALLAHSQTSINIQNPEGQALIGVEVYSDNLAFANVSDENGNVTIPKEIYLVNFRYLGYQLLKININQLQKPIIMMQREEQIVEQVTIVGRTGVIKEEIPYQIETIDQKTLSLSNSQTSADALAANANVYVQKSQMGGGSPVLRGFEANKILLVVDGVRLNNAIYRSGHLQNAITIDQAMLERMEVIFGAGSLNYGSDALGGVIHFRGREPQLNFNPDKKANINQGYSIRYSSANKENSFHYDLMYAKKKWGSLSSISYSKFDDLRTGSKRSDSYPDYGIRSDYVSSINGQDSIVLNANQNLQIGTGYAQLDIMQKFVFQPNPKTKFVLNGQYSTSTDVPRYDMLTERQSDGSLKFAEWYYGPQNRLLLSAKLEQKTTSPIFDKSLIIASYQKIDEDRIDREFGSSNKSFQQEDVDVIGLTADFSKKLNTINTQTINYGLDFQYNNVESESFEENITSLIRNYNVLGRYPSEGSSMHSFGIFSQYTWKSKNEKLISNTGLRYSTSSINVKYDSNDPFAWPQSFINGLNSTNTSLVGSSGFNYNSTKGWQLHGLLATAFRAPNIDDMAKIRVKGGEVSVPNLDLKPEKSLNIEIGFTKRDKENNFIQAALFYTKLDDVIIREALDLPDGSNVIIDGLDTLKTFGNVNADNGYIYGFTSNASFQLSKDLNWNASINYTYGRAEGENGERPLSHIPPIFGKTGLMWKKEAFSISGIFRFNAKKDISDFGDSTDNPEQATPEGSLAWNTLNLYFNYPFKNELEFSLGMENLLDVHYRQFASGVSAPGRNIILSLKGRF